jgi:hypothetical protein
MSGLSDSLLPIVMPSIPICQFVYKRTHSLQLVGQFQSPDNPMRWNDAKKRALDHQILFPVHLIEMLSLIETEPRSPSDGIVRKFENYLICPFSLSGHCFIPLLYNQEVEWHSRSGLVRMKACAPLERTQYGPRIHCVSDGKSNSPRCKPLFCN